MDENTKKKRVTARPVSTRSISKGVWTRDSWKLECLGERADDISLLYSTAGVRLSPKCELYRLISKARHIAARWTREGLVDQQDLFQALHFMRITEAVFQLSGKKLSVNHLRALSKGSLNFFHPGRSKAKDFFWEIELWSKIQRKIPEAMLKEPPDIVVEFEGRVFGIACKKIYSLSHLQNVLSQAVGQVEGAFDLGVVALDLDELLPLGCLLKARDADAMKRELSTRNTNFLSENDMYFRDYLSKGRICGAIVSMSAIVDIPSESPRFGNASTMTAWTIDNGVSDNSKRLVRLIEKVQE